MSKKLVYGPVVEQTPRVDTAPAGPVPRKAPPKQEGGLSGGPGHPRHGLYKPVKQRVTIRLDADVIAWFKVQAKDGPGYQTLINKALREYMLAG